MSETAIGRRDFLVAGGAVAGALLMGEDALSASFFTLGPDAATMRQGTSAAGETAPAGRRLLLAYASAAGSTAETAAFLAKRLSGRGWAVDLREARKAPAPKDYSAVIVGSAVRAGNWLSDATEYVKAHRQELAKTRPVYFTMCMTLSKDTPANREAVAAYIKPVRELVKPRSAAFFAGKMDYSKLSFFMRQIVKMKKVPEGDFRNWTALAEWVDGLDRELAAGA